MSFLPRPILQDLPRNIKENIVSRVDFKTRISLRNCTKQFRNIVDTFPAVYDRIAIAKVHNRIAANIVISWELIVSTDHTRLRLKASEDQLLRVLKAIFNNPRAHSIELFITDLDFEFQTLLTSLNQKISLVKLQIQNDLNKEKVSTLLPYLKPGVLEQLALSFERNTVLDQVFQLEQWKQAKSIKLFAVNMQNNIIQHVLHLQEFRLLEITHLTLEDAKKIVATALKMGKEFRSFSIRSNTSDESIQQHFGKESFFDIPESDNELKLFCSPENFLLRKLEEDSDEEEENEEDADDEEEVEDEEDFDEE